MPHEEDDSGRAGKETSCGVPCEGESQRQVRGSEVHRQKKKGEPIWLSLLSRVGGRTPAGAEPHRACPDCPDMGAGSKRIVEPVLGHLGDEAGGLAARLDHIFSSEGHDLHFGCFIILHIVYPP